MSLVVVEVVHGVHLMVVKVVLEVLEVAAVDHWVRCQVVLLVLLG
jgi:hypothetical protein